MRFQIPNFRFQISALLLFSFFIFHFSPLSAAKADKQTVVLSVDLHCQGCIDKIMKHIAFEPGVKDIVCDLKTKTVTITYDTRKTDLPTLLKAFDKIKKTTKLLQPKM